MTRKGLTNAAVLTLGLLAGIVAPAAQAVTTVPTNKASLKSGKPTTSVCVNPTPGFEPATETETPNKAPLTTSSTTGEGFPTGPENCSTYLASAYVLNKAGQPAGPWSGYLRGASWLSFTPSAESSNNPVSPAYYIYEIDFAGKCPTTVATGKLTVKTLSDENVGVFLNGHSLGSGETNYNGPATKFATPKTGAAADFLPGTNKVQFAVLDTGGWTGIDFAGSAAWTCA